MENLLPLLFKAIQFAPQIQSAIKTGAPVINAVSNTAPDLIPLLEQIGKSVFPQLSGVNAQAAAGGMIFNAERTAAMQADLNRLGETPPLEVDGVYGLATKAAVAKFQSSHGLSSDGWAGAQTMPAIAAAVKALGRGAETPSTSQRVQPIVGQPLSPTSSSPLPLQPSPDAATSATMSALRVGMRGERVAAWQSFLLGRGFDNGPIDGSFGEHTRDATKAFQRKYKLEENGVAGRETLLKAGALGLELFEEPAEDETSSNFPSRPSFPPLTSNEQRAAIFGHYQYVSAPEIDNQEAIRILGTWEKENIVNVPIPQLRKALGNKAPQTIQFHHLAASQLKGMWAEWEKEKLLDRILVYDGSFVPRFVRGSRTVLSNHAFGSAFDINEKYNHLGSRPALVGEKGCVRELVPIANRWGFYWGGHYSGRLDGMHFEVAFLTSNNDV